MEEENKKETIELPAFELNLNHCDACNGSHRILVKQLVNKFEITGSHNVKFYKFIKIGEKQEVNEDGRVVVSDVEEPILLDEFEEGAIEFSKPRLFESEEGTKRDFSMWSWCGNAKEPLFLSFQIRVEKND